MNLPKLSVLFTTSALAVVVHANPVTLVQTSDAGYYNHAIGTVLNNTNGGDTSSGYFPVSNDAAVTFLTAPDLSAAAGALGNWLGDPLHLNANWDHLASIPNSWTPGTEVGVIYQFNTLGATNVVASFGVDNGIYIWLDGVYIGGARGGGFAVPNEYVYSLGDLNAGTHFLQLLLEDHGVANGYFVTITADTFVPGPPPTVPETATFSLYALAFGFLAAARRFLGRR